MFEMRNRLLRFFLLFYALTLFPQVFSTGYQRWQGDRSGVRGNSFGLENFLFHGYEDPEINEAIKDAKKVRPIAPFRVEGENVDLTEMTILRTTTVKPIAVSAGKNKQKVSAKPPLEIFKETIKPAETSNIATTDRSRPSRVVLRRRKRPHNSQLGSSLESPEKKISKLNRQTLNPKITIRTTLSPLKSSDSLKANEQVRSTNPKLLPFSTTPRHKMSQEERIQRMEITKVPEHSTPSAQRKTLSPQNAFTINLKDFLKQQTETLSLSELLQTQNLSLADLLRGNKEATSILKAKFSPTPSTSNLKRDTIYTVEPSTEQALSAGSKIRELARKSPREETIAVEPGTEEPSKVSTNNLPTIVASEENYVKEKENVKTTRRTSLHSLGTSSVDPQIRINEFRAKLRNYQKRIVTTAEPEELPSTLQKESATTTTITPSTTVVKTTEIPAYKNKRIPYKSSNNPHLSLIVPDKKSDAKEKTQDNTTNSTEGRLFATPRPDPERSTQKENQTRQSIKAHVQDTNVSRPEEKSMATESATAATTAKRYDEYKKPEVKDDLVELLRSGHGAEALKKVLESRNMTLEEILNNREKSTVHSNIEELFSSRQAINIFSTQPTLNVDIDFGTGDSYSFSNDPSPTGPRSPEGTRYAVPIRESKRFNFPVSNIYEESVLNFRPDDLTADTSNNENLAVWKLSEKNIIYGSTFAHGGPLSVKHYTDRPKILKSTPEPEEDDIILLETLERDREAAQNLDEFRSSDHSERSYIPPAVKSAIIASGVVLGIALFVFIVIFAACGWRQRRLRLRGSTSMLSEALTKSRDNSKRTDTLHPINFSDIKTYKKNIEFDENDDSESSASFAGSYLWSTFKNTFTSRANTLKNRIEKEEKNREDKLTLRGNESRKKVKSFDDPEGFISNFSSPSEGLKKIDRNRSVINTSFNFKRSLNKDNVNYFSECSHRY